MTHRAGLAGFTATVHVDLDVERLEMAGQFERLAHDHAAGFASEELVDRLAVDDDLARTLLDENTSHRGLRRPVP